MAEGSGEARTGAALAGAALAGEVVWAGGHGDPPPVKATRPRRPAVAFSAEAMREVLRWVMAGEALSVACARPGLPTHGTVNAWARSVAAFREKLNLAKEAAGWMSPTHRGPQYCEITAQVIYARLCAGQSLRAICADPMMPGKSTVYRWRGSRPEFAALLREARAVQAEDVAERGMEIADAVTPGTAYAVEVRLRQYRWTAGVYNPALFGRFRPVDHESVGAAAAEGPREVFIRVKRYVKKQREDGSWYLEEVLTEAEELERQAGGALADGGTGSGGSADSVPGRGPLRSGA